MMLLMALLIGIRHAELLRAPNQLFIGDSYDGFRTMVAAMYHVEHDSSYSHYGGMHYPYGDGVGFVDIQPLIVNTIKFIDRHVADISPYTPAIMNVGLLFSLWLSGILLFLLLRRLGTADWFSLLAAAGIALLSPQVERFWAHYGLAHAFALPLIMYLLLRFEQGRHWRWSLAIGLSVWVLYHLHAYLFAISFFLVGLYSVVRLLSGFSLPKLWQQVPQLTLQLLLPLIALLIANSFDPVVDRSQFPYGFLMYEAHWDTVFLSPEFQSGRVLRRWLPFTSEQLSYESHAYVGMAVSLFLFWELIRLLRLRNWRRAYNFCQDRTRKYLRTLLIAATVLLLFSFGLPFKLPAFEWLGDHIGPLRQFRSLGRFAWAFYYVANVAVFFLIYQQSQRIASKRWRMALLLLALGILYFEAITFNIKKDAKLMPRPEQRIEYRAADNPWLDSLDLSKYQAILPVPFYHVGSENFWLSKEGKTMHRSLWAATQTGLPAMASYMGRTSLSQTIRLRELIGEPYRIPAVLDDLPNGKPLLLFVVKGDYEPVWYRFDHLMYYIKSIYEDAHLKLYTLSIKEITERVGRRRAELRAELDSLNLFEHTALLSADSLPDYVYQSFDEQAVEPAYRGGGAFTGIGRQQNVLFEGHIPAQREDYRYVFSLWYFVNQDRHPKAQIQFREIDTASGSIIVEKTYRLREYIRSIDGDWALTDIPVHLQSARSRIQIVLENEDLRGQPFWVDELQIRPQKARVFKKTATEFARNNRWFGYESGEKQGR